MGNICEVKENGETVCKYEYDTLGRLTREDNLAFGKTTTWAYDVNGNITAKREYSLTAKPTDKLYSLDGTCILYGYGECGDRLLSYGNEAIVYDAVGNPIVYKGKTASWQYGKQLTAYDGNTFVYDARGRRIGKNGMTYRYDHDGNLLTQSNGLSFLYDHTGLLALTYRGETYLYRKDVQGNIIAMLDTNGNIVVKYVYDAWGNESKTVDNCFWRSETAQNVQSTFGKQGAEGAICDCDTRRLCDGGGKCLVDASTTNVALADLNPFRYRSYYYDTETGLYFLKTRYYDPETGRFLSPDSVEYLDPNTIGGLNLYAYCNNNPVMNVDPDGHLVITTSLIISVAIWGAIVGAVAGGVYGGIVANATGQSVWGGIVLGAFGGAIMGAGAGIGTLLMAPAISVTATVGVASVTMNSLLSFAVGAAVAFGTGAGAGAITEIMSQKWNNGKVDNWQSVGYSALQWGVLNLGSGFFAALGEAAVIGATACFTTKALSIIFGNIKVDAAIGFLGMLLDYARSA